MLDSYNVAIPDKARQLLMRTGNGPQEQGNTHVTSLMNVCSCIACMDTYYSAFKVPHKRAVHANQSVTDVKVTKNKKVNQFFSIADITGGVSAGELLQTHRTQPLDSHPELISDLMFGAPGICIVEEEM